MLPFWMEGFLWDEMAYFRDVLFKQEQWTQGRLLSNLYKCRDYKMETHLNYLKKKDQLNNITFHCLGFPSCPMTFRELIEYILCVSSHPHWIPSSSLARWPGCSPLLVLKQRLHQKLWAAEFHRLSAGHHLSSLEAPALPATSRPGWNVIVKGIGVYFLCAFKWVEGGQDEAIRKHGQ